MPRYKCTTRRDDLKIPKKPQLTFLVKLERLLSETPVISREEFSGAKELLRSEFYAKQLRREGPCLLCKSPMRYGEPSIAHKSRGDAWLDKTQEKFDKLRGVTVSLTYQTPFKVDSVNGVSYDPVRPYLCAFCQIKIRDKGEVAAAEKKAYGVQAREREYEQRSAIFRGDAPAPPSERFRILFSFVRAEDGPALRDMEYNEFLQTRYWDIIRRYVLYKRGANCELCNEKRMVHVHHRTYEHHGWEHEHLGDLIVLCDKCHATFHNKLGRGKKASEQQEANHV